MITLENDIWSLVLSPKNGASLVSGYCFGFPVFAPARRGFQSDKDVFDSSCFPLVPFSNRIGGGQFNFFGQSYAIAPNHPKNVLPIHGNGWEHIWTVEDKTIDSCRMVFDYRPKQGGWPWAFKAEQTVTLKGSSLVFSLMVENKSDQACPAGLGLHPSFTASKGTQIGFNASSIWEADADLLPITLSPLSSKTDFSNSKVIDGVQLDNCFSGWDGEAIIRWPGFDHGILMRADQNFPHLVVYARPENDFICLEPVSHVNNALNMTGKNAIRVLKPNEQIISHILFKPN